MDIDDEQNEESIPDGAVLMTANNILNLLEYSEQLTNEEDLFSDEFYISILSNLLTDKKFDIQPGETPEEKVKSLKKLIKLLSEIIEMDLSQIRAEGIIMEHDKASAKSFLELLEELIKTLMNANLGEEESENNNDNEENKMEENKEESNKEDKSKNEDKELKNESFSDNNENNYIKPNNSEGNVFGGNKTKYHLDDIDNENDENDINIKFNNLNKKRLNKDEEIDINELKKEEEKEEKNINKSKTSEKNDLNDVNVNDDINDNENNINNSSNEEIRISAESFRRLNQSNIEQLELEKMFKNYENKNEESYIRKTYSQNDLSEYEKHLAENENEGEEEGSSEKDNEKSEKIEDKKKEILSSPEEGEKNFGDGGLDLNYNLEDKNNLSGSPIMNVSHISELSQDKSKNKENSEKENENENEKNSEKKSNKKNSSGNIEENSDFNNKSIKSKKKSNKSSSRKNNLESSSKKNIDDDIPDLFIDKNKKSNNSNKFEYDDEDEEEKIKKEYKNNNYFDSNEDESNLEGEEENYYIPHSVPRTYNKLQLPSASKESESSHENKNKRQILKESNSSLTNSNISFHSKNSKKSSKKKIEYNEINDISNSSSNKKNSKGVNTNKKSLIKNETNKKENTSSGTKSNKSKRSQKDNRISEENEESVSDISKSSIYTNAHEKSSKLSSSSKKSETSKKNKSDNNLEKNKNSSKKSIKSNKKIIYNNNINIEIPMTDEEIKYEIMKELKRLYGEKAKRYYDKNFLELIIENIKLARKTILKLETGIEPDDYFSREFMLKYQKEIQKILKYYIEEKKRENNYKQNAILSIGQNIKFIKKLKEAELKDILDEIEYKKKEKEIQNEEEQNQILLYPNYCYELQKQICLAETQNQIDLNNAIEEERKKSILESQKSYNDRIAILYEILKREKRERINQKKLNERLEYELKSMSKKRLKKQVEDMLDQIDEEDRKINNEDNNNQEEIEKILHNFY